MAQAQTDTNIDARWTVQPNIPKNTIRGVVSAVSRKSFVICSESVLYVSDKCESKQQGIHRYDGETTAWHQLVGYADSGHEKLVDIECHEIAATPQRIFIIGTRQPMLIYDVDAQGFRASFGYEQPIKNGK